MSSGVYVRTEEIHFKPKICARCGKEFKPASSTQKYCEECSLIVARERVRNWRQRNLEKKREYSKNWQQRNKEHYNEYNKHWRQENKEYNRRWKEGHRERIKKYKNKRYRQFGFIPLNKPFNGAEGHHIDRNYVIYIPKKIHQGIRHSVLKNRNIDEINAVAFNYL